MKRFMVIGYATPEAMMNMQGMSQEEGKQMMAKWMAWQEKYQKHVVDMGSPLMKGIHVNHFGEKTEVKSHVAGYMILQGENKEAVLNCLYESPILDYGEGNAYEVFECLK